MMDIALIQLGTASIPSGATATLTLLRDAPSGSTVVLFLGETGTSALITVTDSENNFWSAGNSQSNGSAIKLAIWIGEITTTIPAGGTIAVTWSGAGPAKLVAGYALTGVVALDQALHGAANTGTSVTITTNPLAQDGNEVALFALLENNGEADTDFADSTGFVSQDALFQGAALYVSSAQPPTSAPLVYKPQVGISNLLAGIGIIYRGVTPIPVVRRMTARIRGIPAHRPTRIASQGTRLYLPSGQRFFPRGANWNQDAIAILDAPILAGMNGNTMRATLGFWIDGSNPRCTVPLPNNHHDAFDPNASATGFLDPGVLAFFLDEINQAIASGIWPIVAMHGGDCNFGTYVWPNDGSPAAGQTIVSLFRQAWQYLVSILKTIDGIFAYEILAEPHPTNNPTSNSNMPASGNGADDTGPGAAWLYNQVIQDIREQDVWTPIAFGAAKDYNPRNLAQILVNMLPSNLKNTVAFVNFFELGSNKYVGAQESGGYVKQTKIWPDFPNGANYVAYPGYFFDNKGDSPNAGGDYPGKGTEVWMDKPWLGGLMDVSVRDSIAAGIPLVIDQFGGPNGDPNYLQYLKDVCALIIERQIGAVYWDQRSQSLVTQPPHGNGEGFIWRDESGDHLKNGQYAGCLAMDIYGQFSGAQNTDDLIEVLSNLFANIVTP